MKEKEKKVLVLSILGVLIMISLVSGITYAYFTSRIEGSNAELKVTTALLGPLKYTGTTLTADGILPGYISEDMSLKVEGPTNTESGVDYYCYMDNIGDITDIEYRIGNDGVGSSISGEWKSITDEYIIKGNININNKSDEYKIGIRFKETGENQNHLQNKSIIVRTSCYLEEMKPDASILAWTLDGSKQSGSFPSKDTEYAVSSVSCTNGAVGTWDNNKWGVFVEQISTTPAKCTVNFVSDGIMFYKQILNDNINIKTRAAGTFNSIFTTSNGGNTIYVASGQDNKDTYYFAGQVTNNYVKFGKNSSNQDLWWRIVRINEDNSVRLIYAGTSATDTAGFISTSQTFSINANTYNRTYYSGYEYAANQQHGTGTNSGIKTAVDNWYTSNLADEGDYLSKTAIYCSDRTNATGYTWGTNSSTPYFYKGWERLTGNYSTTDMTYYPFYGKAVAPTFSCTNDADKFTVSSRTGNGALENPIALITADEISYAGGLYPVNNTSYYIANNANTGAAYWWTMTPSSCNSSGGADVFRVGGSSLTGRLGSAGVHNTYGVRPVVSLKSCALFSGGTGTSSDPYTVDITDACKSAEN